MIKKKNQCRTCKNVIISPDSKLSGRCYYCRNYTKIERLRMVEHGKFMEQMNEMPVNSPFQRYEKRMVREELLFGRQTFIKFGRVERPTKYKEQEKIDNWVIQVAIKNPEYEKKIQWVKMNKGMLK
jgi:hypothetical protein